MEKIRFLVREKLTNRDIQIRVSSRPLDESRMSATEQNLSNHSQCPQLAQTLDGLRAKLVHQAKETRRFVVSQKDERFTPDQTFPR